MQGWTLLLELINHNYYQRCLLILVHKSGVISEKRESYECKKHVDILLATTGHELATCWITCLNYCQFWKASKIIESKGLTGQIFLSCKITSLYYEFKCGYLYTTLLLHSYFVSTKWSIFHFVIVIMSPTGSEKEDRTSFLIFKI